MTHVICTNVRSKASASIGWLFVLLAGAFLLPASGMGLAAARAPRD